MKKTPASQIVDAFAPNAGTLSAKDRPSDAEIVAAVARGLLMPKGSTAEAVLARLRADAPLLKGAPRKLAALSAKMFGLSVADADAHIGRLITTTSAKR